MDRLEIDHQVVLFASSERMDQLQDGEVGLVITSPPYWNLKDYDHPDQIGQETYEGYLERMNGVWRECARVASENAVLAINVGNRRVNKRFYPIGWDIYSRMPEPWKLIDNLIWYIPNALPQPNYYKESLFDDKYENVLLFAKNLRYEHTFNKMRVRQKYSAADPRRGKRNPRGRCIGNVIRIPAYKPPNIKELGYYKAGFPEELVYLLIHTFSNRGDTVLDPFLGSGTTLKVARNTGRKGVGYEINPDLRELIGRRVSEKWTPPDFEDLDIIHSSSNVPGMNGRVRRSDLRGRRLENGYHESVERPRSD
ncbi:MAG: DNA-methyltransferase [Methanomassiliicoccales archaeon]